MVSEALINKSKQKIVIFSGADMTGKSNIAEELSKQLNIKTYKCKMEHDRYVDFTNMLLYGSEQVVQMLEQLNINVILDRFHESEYAYSKLFNRYTSFEKIFNIDTRLAKMNAVIVYLEKDKEFYIKDDLGLIEINQYDDVKKHYEFFLEKTKCKVIRLNTNSEDLEEQINYIKGELNEYWDN